MASGGKGIGGSRFGKGIRVSAEVLKALNHEIRREALRLLHLRGGAASAVQLSQSIAVPTTTISYHLKVLDDAGIVALVDERRFKGFSEKFFTSTVADNALIVSVLHESEDDDDPIRR